MPYRLKSIINYFLSGFTILILIITVNACLDNFNRDLDTIYYNPSYSVPIGPLSYSMEDIMPYLALTDPIPDITLLPDTFDFPFLIYDDTLYFINPEEGYDTIFYEYFDMNSIIEQSEYIVSVMFRSNISNELPVNTSLQVYYFDGYGTALDSLYDDGRIVIQSPEVTSQDSVLIPFVTTIDTYLDEEEIQHLRESSQLALYIHLQTYQPDDDTLYVYSYQEFNVQLGMRIELLVPLE